MDTVHLKKASFSCDVCDKKFYRKVDLENHTNTHNGVRRYSCPECSRSFSHVSNLHRHSRLHSRQKPYICGECGKRFTQSSTLVAHRRLHDRSLLLPCGRCPRRFLRPVQRRRHLETVHGALLPDQGPALPRPFYCQICGLTFEVKLDLSRHVAGVHADAPKCIVCGEVFESLNLLTAHTCTGTGRSGRPAADLLQTTATAPHFSGKCSLENSFYLNYDRFSKKKLIKGIN